MAVAPGISDASEPTGENQYRAGSSKSFMSMLPELVINLYDSSRSDGDCTHSPTAGSVLRFNSSANMARRGRLVRMDDKPHGDRLDALSKLPNLAAAWKSAPGWSAALFVNWRHAVALRYRKPVISYTPGIRLLDLSKISSLRI
ncbi:hypothetical protein Pst134EA_024198 [Puccinia striiformis f. sp. tritici]|uniref:hypothetical protein n=1 Tax=Puccinia striiformis f. sp. tritici TaxID=168172 RepID=UPI0020089BC8|nr:hypothetical protein Pst134EA_024198 [Puccinia striiformis f. sp. tritici]KAH9453319.1 hypothetical protein Pst134EA_024198 [Puccinia striiformis f. sp. tritici]